jgi:hypothetical protein
MGGNNNFVYFFKYTNALVSWRKGERVKKEKKLLHLLAN